METETIIPKEYLGDSVYASFDGYHIVLTTENGDSPSNIIALEPEVLAALDRYRKLLNSAVATNDLPEGNEMAATIKRAREYSLESAERVSRGGSRVANILASLSPSCDLNPFGGTFWFTVTNREDLQALMEVAPRWNKSANELGIAYQAEVDGVDFRIQAKDAALPPTCRLVERVVEVAETVIPAHTERKMVVECNAQETTEGHSA